MRRYKLTSCTECGASINAVAGVKHCRPCRKRIVNERCKARFKRNHAAGFCWCGRDRVEGFQRCIVCRANAVRERARSKSRKNAQGKEYRDKLKAEVFAAYGNACACCGENIKEFLEVDHIGGWGHKHVDENGRRFAGCYLFRWLKVNNYPEGFRLLCGSCHSAISYWGYCPHDRMSAPELVTTAVNWNCDPPLQ